MDERLTHREGVSRRSAWRVAQQQQLCVWGWQDWRAGSTTTTTDSRCLAGGARGRGRDATLALTRGKLHLH